MFGLRIFCVWRRRPGKVFGGEKRRASGAEQLVDQVEKDMKILGRLRAENRELKGQLRKIRMDEAVAAQAKDPADIQAAVDAAAAMRREKVAAEENFDKAEAAKTERAVRARQRAEEAEKKAEERGEKKSGGFWDNAFPF